MVSGCHGPLQYLAESQQGNTSGRYISHRRTMYQHLPHHAVLHFCGEPSGTPNDCSRDLQNQIPLTKAMVSGFDRANSLDDSKSASFGGFSSVLRQTGRFGRRHTEKPCGKATKVNKKRFTWYSDQSEANTTLLPDKYPKG